MKNFSKVYELQALFQVIKTAFYVIQICGNTC